MHNLRRLFLFCALFLFFNPADDSLAELQLAGLQLAELQLAELQLAELQLAGRNAELNLSGDRFVPRDSARGRYFVDRVQPLLERRCVACHACYDAPCQLKLSSVEGIDRGLSKQSVYAGKRLVAANTTRLFLDHHSREAWRENDFFPVLGEGGEADSYQDSLLYRVLQLKAEHPLPETRTLSEEHFDLSLKRENQCPRPEEYSGYSDEQPLAGMPYGLPGISAAEHRVLRRWLRDGAALVRAEPLSGAQLQQIQVWEAFLNQDHNRGKLVARYLYEHLFLANLYFSVLEESPRERDYFRLVRSRTPPGQEIDVIASRRPVDDPEEKEFYYRLQPRPVSRITKTHLPYALNPERMNWFHQLFFKPRYQVASLPGYQREDFNPFRTFAAIPAESRYRFLLEESHFFIAGFIRGPVCRGPVAVDVINDQFWVYFVNPDAKALSNFDDFLERQTPNLRLPGERGSNAGLLSYWTTYSDLHRKYMLAKAKAKRKAFAKYALDLNLIWDGDGNNANAALTVFRNFDDAVVIKGLLGEPPKTAWVVDYPLLERIHYLLTADFDVFGNVGHQLNTRLYMDFLRIEGEYNFLSLLPVDARVAERDHWYRESSKRLHDQIYSYDMQSLQAPDIDYQTAKPKLELYALLRERLAPVLDDSYHLSNEHVPSSQREALRKLYDLRGKPASLMAETTILLVENDTEQATLYTLLANRAHLNITSLFREQSNRLPEEDSISAAYGVVGDYPNTFLRVEESRLPDLVNAIAALASEEDYSRLLDNYAVRRTDPAFWQHSDRIHHLFWKQQPEQAGRLDYNRLENR